MRRGPGDRWRPGIGQSLPSGSVHARDPSWNGLVPTARLPRMATPAISRYPVPKLEDLPEDFRARMRDVQEKAGFIPNVFLTLAHRPDEFRAFFTCCNERFQLRFKLCGRRGRAHSGSSGRTSFACRVGTSITRLSFDCPGLAPHTPPGGPRRVLSRAYRRACRRRTTSISRRSTQAPSCRARRPSCRRPVRATPATQSSTPGNQQASRGSR